MKCWWARALAVAGWMGVAALCAAGQGRFGGFGGAPTAPLQFRNLGPAQGGGRLCCVVSVPGNPLIIYVGGGGGGVWKTSDGGGSWTPIFEHEATSSIGALALAPSNPSLLWVGTGESNVRNDVIVGKGLYFSPDGGAMFQEISPETFHNAGQIARIVINPRDPNEVWVAVLGHAFGPNPERGVYHTTDGGKTWARTLFVDDNTGAIDLAMQPGNPRVLVAAMWQTVRHPWDLESGGPGSGIYKSDDGGVTWRKIETGLAPGPYGRIAVGFAPSAPERLYALVEAKTGLFWRSDDAGEHWTAVNDNWELDGRPFYFTRFEVAPNDPDKIIFLQVSMYESDDGGRTVRQIGTNTHSDHHSLWIDPDNPKRMLDGCDGGLFISQDGGQNFVKYDNLTLEQIYSVHTDSELPYHVCVGLQDNGGWCGPSRSQAVPDTWTMRVGGDGQYVVPAPSDPHILYADSQGGAIQRTDLSNGVERSVKPYAPSAENTAAAALKYRFNWTSPIAVDATDANTVYLGGNVLFKSTNGGQSWTPISPDLTMDDKTKEVQSGGPIDYDLTGAELSEDLLSVMLAPTDPNTIWTGADDGTVSVTHDGGKTWQRASDNIDRSRLPTWGRVQQIEVSPFDPNTAFVAFDRHEMEDNKPYVFKTHDSGKTWTEIDAGLPPDYSAIVVREDPNQKGFLALGTMLGLYVSHDEGASWQRYQQNMPNVPIFDIKFVKKTHDLLVATHGRGLFVLDNIIPLEQMTPEVTASAFHLFPTLDPSYRFQGPAGFGVTAAGMGTTGIVWPVPNPPNGVEIDYWLSTAQPRGEPVRVAITTATGTPVTTLTGSGHAGLNQVFWNGNYDGPRPLRVALPGGRGGGGGGGGGRGAAGGGRGGAGGGVSDNGPRAVQGSYKVTVTANGESQSEDVALMDDPRVTINVAAETASLRAALAAQQDVSVIDDLVNQVDSLHNQLTAAERTLDEQGGRFVNVVAQARQVDDKVDAMLTELVDLNPRQKPYGQLQAFYQQFSGAARRVGSEFNEPPRQSDLEEWEAGRAQLDTYLKRYNEIVANDLAAYNRMAVAQGAVTVVAGAPLTLPPLQPTVTARRP